MKFSTIIKSLLLVLVAIGGWYGGLKWARQTTALVAEPTDTTAEVSTAASNPTPNALAAKPAAAPTERAPASVAPAAAAAKETRGDKGTPGDFSSLVDSRGFESRAKELSQAFPKTDAGRNLAEMSTFVKFGPAVGSPESKLVAERLEWLKAHPSETLEGIRAGLNGLSASYGSERQFLLHLTTQLDVDRSSKMDLLSDQLTHPGAPMDNSIALSTMLTVVQDPSEVEPALRKAIDAQGSNEQKQLLLSMYQAAAPEQGKRLRADLGF